MSALLDYLLELRDRDFAQQFLVFVELPSSRQEGAFCRAELLLLGSVQEADELVVGCVRVSGGVHEEVSAAGGTVALEALFGHGEGGHPDLLEVYARLGGIGGECEEARHVDDLTFVVDPLEDKRSTPASPLLLTSKNSLRPIFLRATQTSRPPEPERAPNQFVPRKVHTC